MAFGLQVAALLPLHRTHQVGCRSVPVTVVPVDLPQRPGRRASPEQMAAWEKEAAKGQPKWQVVTGVEQLGDALGDRREHIRRWRPVRDQRRDHLGVRALQRVSWARSCGGSHDGRVTTGPHDAVPFFDRIASLIVAIAAASSPVHAGSTLSRSTSSGVSVPSPSASHCVK